MLKHILCVVSALLCGCHFNGAQKSIDIIIPIEHPALRQEIEGFQQSFKHKNYKINVLNANGDTNLQRSFIKQSRAEILIPISTSVTQMAFALRPDVKVIGLASNILNDENPNHVVVKDQTNMKEHLELLNYLGIKSITIIHSINEKIYHEVNELEQLCLDNNIQVQKLTIQGLPDIYQITKAVKNDTIFILKDVMVANGIPTLVQHHNGTVIASDEISVKNGANFAIGVYEKDIGIAGGEIANEMLSGNQVKNIILDKLSLFINVQKVKDIELLKQYGARKGYAIHVFDGDA